MKTSAKMQNLRDAKWQKQVKNDMFKWHELKKDRMRGVCKMWYDDVMAYATYVVSKLAELWSKPN